MGKGVVRVSLLLPPRQNLDPYITPLPLVGLKYVPAQTLHSGDGHQYIGLVA